MRMSTLTLLMVGLTAAGFVALAQEQRPVIEKALAGPLAGVNELIFVTRAPYDDPHWYANIGYYCDDENHKARAGNGQPDVGKIYTLAIRTGNAAVLFDAEGGSVRDPQVHYDGTKILFSFRQHGGVTPPAPDTDYYHLYEINTDGSGLRPITTGPYDDIEAIYLPDGEILFASTRSKRWVNCWMTQVATLFRCDADGGNIRPVSGNTEHDNTPWVMPDGRILYTRWEYVDRSQVDFHHLWTMNPDGSNQQAFYGNMRPGTVMIDAKPIPGTDQVLATFSPGHGINEHRGPVAILDVKRGPDDPDAARIVLKKHIQDPYPLSVDCFLAAQDKQIFVFDAEGKADVLFDYAGEGAIHEPRPIMPRPRERVLATRADFNQSTGELFLADVYTGRNMAGVVRGDIKQLLILELLPKPVNFSGGPDLLSWLGTFTLERIMGVVPVEEDGSAYFQLPANRSFFFVALDKDGLAVKRMQSFLSLAPGERLSCVGCHESRLQTPANSGHGFLLAAQRPPSPIAPFEGFPDVLDFNRDIQPILNQHCVECHNFSRREGHVSLVGDLGPTYSHSFYALYANNQVADGRNGLGNQPPRSIGSSASALMKKIDGGHSGGGRHPAGHHDVKLSPRDWRMVWLWIESGATYAGTYAALRNAEEQGFSRPGMVFGSQKAVLERRCAACHAIDNANDGERMALPFYPEIEERRRAANRPTTAHERIVLPNDPLARFSVHILLNLSQPENSPLLLGPLAHDAGGLGSCGNVFKDKEDPDYKSLLAAIEDCKAKAETRPRYATPGFRPNRQYIREMKNYGILPAAFNADTDPIDPFQIDQAYWRDASLGNYSVIVAIKAK